MIFLDRSEIEIPKVLSGDEKNNKGLRETKKAIEHFSKPNQGKFNFRVYREDEVKTRLKELCNNKCAYCESKFLHVYPGDVEHFRPKGEISNIANDPKPGYYWLGAEWSNLLLSCRNCNQKLRHVIAFENDKISGGKMNQFPLSDLNKYVRNHWVEGGIELEEHYRLLIDPCKDNPEDHLEYDLTNGIILPKKIGGLPSIKGKTSIEVFVLQRVPLVLEREKLLIEIYSRIYKVIEVITKLNKSIDDQREKQFYWELELKTELELLKSYVVQNAIYSAMAKQLIFKFFNINNITIN